MNANDRNENWAINEIQIPVPWGYISVKAWGNKEDPHVLVFHGIADNAGSFDNLIPYLSTNFYYLCVDFPGHGYSSPFPPYLPLHSTDFLIVYKLIAEYFQKQKYIIIGHSYGGQISFLFARAYPQYVEKLITLDALILFTIEAKESMKLLKYRLENTEKVLERKQNTYTYEQAVNLISKSRIDESLTKEACEALLKRCLQLQGKTWGDSKDPLILCFHGIVDNAGIFDRLMPYLPNRFFYVAIDLPGHGRSSHFPPHLPIHVNNFVIADYFKRQFIILGHSFGGQIGYLYAQLYPEKVKKLIMLDTITIFPNSTRNFVDYLKERTHVFIDLENKMATGVQPTYTKEEALHRLHTSRSYAPIKLEGAVALLERIEQIEDGKYVLFTLDQRMKNTILPLRDLRNVIEATKYYPPRCPMLIILGTESTSQQIYFSSLLQFLNLKKIVRIKYAEGNHDVHNDYPERVAPLVNKFLLYKLNKL